MLTADRTERMTEARLIERACEGDPLAVRTLYERYSSRVFGVVRRIAGDDDLAQDFAQEAWIRAFRALPSFRGDSRFSTWVHRIAVNAALQAVRSAGTRERRETDLPDTIPVAPKHRDVLLEDRLQRAMDRVPEGMRRVLILHDVEGYTHEEIGEALGINPGTSKSQLFKARARMRVLLRGSDAADLDEGAEAWSI
jgi:RNA polymerase sigma-70 factor, ECF subfamily